MTLQLRIYMICQFPWFLSHNGPESWETRDKAFRESRERRAMRSDPARNIGPMAQHFLTPTI